MFILYYLWGKYFELNSVLIHLMCLLYDFSILLKLIILIKEPINEYNSENILPTQYNKEMKILFK